MEMFPQEAIMVATKAVIPFSHREDKKSPPLFSIRANNGNIWVYGCKDIASLDRHNQLWQLGPTVNHW
jgi:hypothetical protein